MDSYDIAGQLAFHYGNRDSELCGCRGSGWICSPWDTWERCSFHPAGRHPEEDETLADADFLGAVEVEVEVVEDDGLMF